MRFIPFIFCITHIFSLKIQFNFKREINNLNDLHQPRELTKLYSFMIDHEPAKSRIMLKRKLLLKTVNKIKNYCNIMRVTNVLPTFILSTIGGLIVQPSITKLLQSKHFWISSVIIQLVMTGSMVINDIFDINVDKINNPNRPLVNGSVHISEAIIIVLSLFSSSIYLSTNFLSSNSNLPNYQKIVTLVLLLYTPVFKRIFLLKNLLCSAIVSSSIYFTGIATTIGITTNTKSLSLLLTATKLIFFSSLCLEILLDIHDYDGDKQNKIITVPVLLGKDFSLGLALKLLGFGIMNIIHETISYPNFVNYSFLVYSLPIFYNIIQCKLQNYSKQSLKKVTSNTLIFLVLSLISIFYCSVNI